MSLSVTATQGLARFTGLHRLTQVATRSAPQAQQSPRWALAAGARLRQDGVRVTRQGRACGRPSSA
jgi:hypothetical protein